MATQVVAGRNYNRTKGKVYEIMNIYGIEVKIKNVPALDPNFVPLYVFNKEFLKYFCNFLVISALCIAITGKFGCGQLCGKCA